MQLFVDVALIRFKKNVCICVSELHTVVCTWSDNVAYWSGSRYLYQYTSEVPDKVYQCVFECVFVCCSIYLIVPVGVLVEKRAEFIYETADKETSCLWLSTLRYASLHTHTYIHTFLFLFLFDFQPSSFLCQCSQSSQSRSIQYGFCCLGGGSPPFFCMVLTIS